VCIELERGRGREREVWKGKVGRRLGLEELEAEVEVEVEIMEVWE
jgi:hypothetical protein